MARKLTLKTASVVGPSGNAMEFDYAEMMAMMLRGGDQPGKGLTLDEIIRALAAIEPIEQAAQRGDHEVTINDSQWQTLREKLDGFQFGFAHRVIAEFGLMIRNAPEIGTEHSEEAKPPRLVS